MVRDTRASTTKRAFTSTVPSHQPSIVIVLLANRNHNSLATEFALETTNTPSKIPVNIKRPTNQTNSSSNNPYILPFAMRGLLEEDYVRRELHDESMGLLKLFDEWQPTTKVLKDVKFRLEGVRSKL